MKGVVFTEFLDMVAGSFSDEMVDDIIDDANLESGGAYTAVGTYPHEEIVALVVALSNRTAIEIPKLLKIYGVYLFKRFVVAYPAFFTELKDTFSFLLSIEDVIHTEVKKLYPDAELPRFYVDLNEENRIILRYASPRHFEDLADGLIHGCIEHFGEPIDVARETVGDDDARQERFILTRA